MRIERILALATAALLGTGLVVWAASGSSVPPRSSMGIWLTAAALSAVPLMGLAIYWLFGRSRKRTPKA